MFYHACQHVGKLSLICRIGSGRFLCATPLRDTLGCLNARWVLILDVEEPKIDKAKLFNSDSKIFVIFTPQPLRAVGVLFSPMVSGWAGGRESGRAGAGKWFVRAVSQKP